MAALGRKLHARLAAALLLCASAPANATPLTVEIVWTGTTSTDAASVASLGTPDYVGRPGDVVTAALVLSIAEGTRISTYGVSIRYDAELGDQLDVVSFDSPYYVFIPEDVFPPTWLWPIHFIPENDESVPGAHGQVGSFSHQLFVDVPTGPFSVTVATVNFVLTNALTAAGTLVQPGYWVLGRDSWIDGNLTNRGATSLTSFDGSVRLLPEPATAVGVGAGALALLALGRRRRD